MWDEPNVPEPYTCEACGEQSWPKVERTIENTDADGNRGVELFSVTCPVCFEEHGWWGSLM